MVSASSRSRYRAPRTSCCRSFDRRVAVLPHDGHGRVSGEHGGLECLGAPLLEGGGGGGVRRAGDAGVQAVVLGPLHVDDALDERLVEAVADEGGVQVVEGLALVADGAAE